MKTGHQIVTIPMLLVWFPSFLLQTRSASGQAHVLDYTVAETGMIVDLVSVLDWTSVILICETNSGCEESSLLQALFYKGVSVMILGQREDRGQAPGPQMRKVTEHCQIIAKGTKTFLVFGSFDFVDQIFRQVVNCFVEINQTKLFFDTEWLTAIPRQKLSVFSDTIRSIQNVAVISHTETGNLTLWTLLHEKDESQLKFVARPLMRSHIFPNPSRGLGSRTLRVVVKGSPPYIINSTVDGSQRYQGLLIDLLHEISLRLNFSYVFVPEADDSWGQQLENGQWDGPIGMLTRKEVDIAVGYFSVSPERFSVADSATPFTHDNAVIVFRMDNARSDSWDFFLKPFQTVVYAVIGGSLVLVLLLLLLVEKYHSDLTGHQQAPSGIRSALEWMVTAFEVLLAGLLTKSMDYVSTSHAGRVLLMTWLTLGLVLASLYSSKLTSSLTVGQQTLPFTSMAELLRQDAYTWGVIAGTSEEALLKNSSIPDYRAFYQGILRFGLTDSSILSSDTRVHFNRLIQGKYALFMASREYTSFTGFDDCQLKVIPESYKTTQLAFHLQKGSPFTAMISSEISKMADSGLIDHWKRKWFPRKPLCDLNDSGVIALADILAAVLGAAFGLAVAAVALVLELLWVFWIKRVAWSAARTVTSLERV